MKKLISINPANENIINQYDQYSEKEVQNIIIKSSRNALHWGSALARGLLETTPAGYIYFFRIKNNNKRGSEGCEPNSLFETNH